MSFQNGTGSGLMQHATGFCCVACCVSDIKKGCLKNIVISTVCCVAGLFISQGAENTSILMVDIMILRTAHTVTFPFFFFPDFCNSYPSDRTPFAIP